MVQIMMSGKKLINRPLRKKTNFTLMHFHVYGVPDNMVKTDNNLKYNRAWQRNYGEKRRNRQRLYKTLQQTQPNALILDISISFITKDCGIMTVMKSGV